MSQRQTSTSEDDCESPPHVAPIEPQAPSRGRRSARTATRRSRRFGPPSPPPARTPADSPASSYRSATPTIPPIEKWTMASLKLALAKSDVQPSRKLNKAELYELYKNLQPTNRSPEPSPASKRTKKTSKPPVAPTPPPSSSHVTPATAQLSTAAAAPPPPATPGPAAQASDWPLPPPISAPPPVSIGSELTAQASAWPHRLPDSAPPPATSNSELAAQASAWSHWLSHTAPPPAPVNSGLADLASAWPHWPPFTAPPPAPASSGLAAQASARPHWPPFTAPPPAPASSVLAAQASARPHWPPFTAPPPAPTSSGLAAQASAWPHALPNTAPPTASFSSLLHTKPQYSLFTASPMPVPPNAIASEPPQVAHNIRAQILAGADVDLSSLLSLLPTAGSNRQIDCGDFSVTLKDSNPHSSRLLSFSEFSIAFSRFTEIICSAFPHRRRELNDYLSIIAELALSYGGGHFYTYHKLFSAKCAVRVTQWNQCPYWGALDPDLHSRVFLGCRNISCAVCRSVAHSTMTCPQIHPSTPPSPVTLPIKSSSYVPRSATTANIELAQTDPPAAESRQPCNSFNSGRCARQRCRFLHVCSFCGGAHARVICPVYKAVNKRSKNYLSTPVNISHLAIELALHPDKEFTNYLLSGLRHGFNPGVECVLSQNKICNNLQSALAEPDVVNDLIKKEVNSGFMIGPFDNPPFEVFRISPVGVATRKFSGKKRLIIDLSSPHNSPVPSINSLIPLDEFSLRYHDIDQAVELIKTAGRGAWLAKVDITSAFKVMPIHPDSWHLFGIRWLEKFYFAVRLTFGCKSSPKIFDMLSEAICWILLNNYAIPHLIHLLDDFLVISPPDAIPAAHILTIQKVFSKLGIPIAEEKTMGPATSIEFLGINLDSVKFQLSLPKEKIDRIILVSSTLLTSPSCSKRELLSLLGHLNFAMRIIPQGRPFISHLLSLASSVHALEDLISLSHACRNELRLWIMFLKQWNGLSLFYNNLVSSPIDIQLFTEAAPSTGFGGFYQGRWFASPWPPQLQGSPQSSAFFELYPLVVAAYLWGNEWTSKSILVHCDNEAAVQCINKGRSHSPALTPLIRRLIWISACDQFILVAKHVPGSENQIADSLSRFLFQKFRTLAPEADKSPTPVPHYSELIFP
ncbi:poly [Labeo rohita]|uniref:ribonuclease H n=1 Tax=Labeo rohita TaxID=84645 RepID=A0A498MLM1_LABRO|nr:poly [Labeo rohita]